MGTRQEYRSRRRKRNQGSGLAGCLLLLAGFLILAAGVIFFVMLNKKSGQEEAEKRDKVNPIVTQPFPEGKKIEEEQGKQPEIQTESVKEAKQDLQAEDGVEAFLASMSLEEKVLQLFMITPEALTGVDEVYAAGKKTEEAVKEYPVGGLIYFRQNLRSPEQAADMIVHVQKYSDDRIGLPLFIGIDEEGGQVTRVGGRKEFGIPAIEDMSKIGASGEPRQAYEAGKQIGAYLSELGFNMDFAPVADVLIHPENTVVAKRSFGSDGAVAAAFVVEAMKGIESQGVIPVLKHFPNHGATSGDTHQGFAYTNRTLEEMKAVDFVPFKEGIDAGACFIMVGHIAAPQVTGDNTPSSLSKVVITDLLRTQLGFDGIVVTDALNMKAVTDQYSAGEAAVKAIQSGVDCLLMPSDFKAAYQGVLEAVENGSITIERIDESVRRILEAKLSRL